MTSTRSLLPDRELATSISLSKKARLAGYQFHVDRYVAVELEGNDSLCGACWCLRGKTRRRRSSGGCSGREIGSMLTGAVGIVSLKWINGGRSVSISRRNEFNLKDVTLGVFETAHRPLSTQAASKYI